MQELGTFSRGEEEHFSRVPLPEILEAALKITATQVGQRARVIRDFRPVPSVDANPAKLGQVFVNLLVNAAQALVTYADAAGRAVVDIHDSGSGIPREALSRIFEPF